MIDLICNFCYTFIKIYRNVLSETIRGINVYEEGDYSMPMFHRYVLRCKKCGQISHDEFIF